MDEECTFRFRASPCGSGTTTVYQARYRIRRQANGDWDYTLVHGSLEQLPGVWLPEGSGQPSTNGIPKEE